MSCKCEGKRLAPKALQKIENSAKRWAEDPALTEAQRELARDLAEAAGALLRSGDNNLADQEGLVRDLCCYLSGVIAHRHGGRQPCAVGSPCDEAA